jgi:hypothetical protein
VGNAILFISKPCVNVLHMMHAKHQGRKHAKGLVYDISSCDKLHFLGDHLGSWEGNIRLLFEVL